MDSDETALSNCDKSFLYILSGLTSRNIDDKFRFLIGLAFYFVAAYSFCQPSAHGSAAIKVGKKNRLSNIDFWHDINTIYAACRALMYHMLQTGLIPILSFVFKRLIYDRLLCVLVNVILVSRGSGTASATSGTN